MAYIGCQISLVTKAEIRYTGTLYSIDPEQARIYLQNVRSFGTEGRRQDGMQIPPSDSTFGFIAFNGTDIKELNVIGGPESGTTDTTTTALSPTTQPPITQPPEPETKPTPGPVVTKPSPIVEEASNINKMVTPLPHVVKEPVAPTHPHTAHRGHTGPVPYRGGGGGGGGYPPRPSRDMPPRGPIPVPESTEGEFDFAAALDKFQKRKELETGASSDVTGGVADGSGNGVIPAPKAYDKTKSFFDTLSSGPGSGERGGAAGRARRDVERRQNTETFGEVALHYRGGGGYSRGGGYHHRGGGGGSDRGGRGGGGDRGGRGGGRGGYRGSRGGYRGGRGGGIDSWAPPRDRQPVAQ